MSEETWVHNLLMLRRQVGDPAMWGRFGFSYNVPSDVHWVGLVIMPERMTEFEVVKDPLLRGGSIVGGWPLIVAFVDEENYILAKIKYSGHEGSHQS